MKLKAKRFSILRSIAEVENAMEKELPQDGFVYKFITDGGYSSISFIVYIADKTTIKNLYVSTLRVGRKQLKMLDVLHHEGKLENVTFIVGSIMSEDGRKKYSYYDDLKAVCDKNKWKVVTAQNHSKILLFDTDDGKFVIETSSNLNENPKFEQFSVEKSPELYAYYLEWFRYVDAKTN